ncbi:MAG: hypothetical protein JW763_05880 [candidate division Zixibacteria bacterium]|nr:hypothetical protein [candidate division Zixibacteria bacterium]
MRILPYLLYLYLLGLHLTILSDVTSIQGVRIDLAALLVILVALYKSDLVALWFALASGIVVGSLRLDLMPWEMFVLGVIAVAIHQSSRRMNLESLTSRLLLLGGFLLLHGLAISLVISTSDFGTMLIRQVIPGTVYTLLFGWLFLLWRDGCLTWEKIKALF